MHYYYFLTVFCPQIMKQTDKLRFCEQTKDGWNISLILQCNPIYFISHCIFKKYEHQTSSNDEKKLGIIRFLMDCSIRFSPSEIHNHHVNGVMVLFIQSKYFMIFPLYFVLCKLPITAVSCKSTSISQFRIDSSLFSFCRRSLNAFNGSQTNFITPSEHQLWLYNISYLQQLLYMNFTKIIFYGKLQLWEMLLVF